MFFDFIFWNPISPDDWQHQRGSYSYFLGDPVHVEVSVATGHHTPLRVYVDRCVATATPDAEATLRYDFIEHHGWVPHPNSEMAARFLQLKWGVFNICPLLLSQLPRRRLPDKLPLPFPTETCWAPAEVSAWCLQVLPRAQQSGQCSFLSFFICFGYCPKCMPLVIHDSLQYTADETWWRSFITFLSPTGLHNLSCEGRSCRINRQLSQQGLLFNGEQVFC